MKFTVFTHVPHYLEQDKQYAYAPYVREMDLWFELVADVEVVAPVKNEFINTDQAYHRHEIDFNEIPSISFLGVLDSLTSMIKIPIILFKIFRAMIIADHFHIRCPGNIGLLACLIQVLFPRRPKTFKYAGNWDPKSEQPWSYKFQKFLISNTFLTRNAKVLVYGKWEDQSSNIKPFFTATYSNNEIQDNNYKDFSEPFRFVFVGSLTPGKRPLLAVKIIQKLNQLEKNVCLDIYGSGSEMIRIDAYLKKWQLESFIKLHGSQDSHVIKQAYLQSHFSILPSKSEGWPKALAEAMFFGCIPISTRISCVPWMLQKGKRGILIEPNMNAVKVILEFLNRKRKLEEISNQSIEWSRQYTLEAFKSEINKLL